MNSLTTAENQQKLSEREIELGTTGTKNSWHNIYRESAWIFVGGLPFDLTEGDVICIFSQYGEIVNINMVRDKKTGKTKGFAFICYEDQRSTILAVDNFNTSKMLQRTLRVDHVKDYRPPDQDDKNVDDVTKMVRAEGVAPRALTPSASEEEEDLLSYSGNEKKKKKKEKKTKKEKKLKREKTDRVIKEEQSSPQRQSVDGRRHQDSMSEVKRERTDANYDKYANGQPSDDRSNRNTSDDRRFHRTHSDNSKQGRSRHADLDKDDYKRQHRPSRSPTHSSLKHRPSRSPAHSSQKLEGKESRHSRRPMGGDDHRRSRSPSGQYAGSGRLRERRRHSRSSSGQHR